MSKLTDPTYLQTQQYRDASNLDARIELHARFSANSYGWMRWLFDQLNLPAGSRILELGCGNASLWSSNAGRLSPTWRLTLSDFSIGMATRARSELNRLHLSTQFIQLDAQHIPFDVAHFDIVIANHMLYHVPHIPAALAEIRRVLKPGGRLYASTVGLRHLNELPKIIGSFDSTLNFDNTPASFILENGQDWLKPFFTAIEMRRYPDSLLVSEARPLVDYYLSSSKPDRQRLLAEAQTFEDFLAKRIQESGPIPITKDSGLFMALTG